jgi:hypothetical protein
MTDHEQTGPLWTEAARAACNARCSAPYDVPCWTVSRLAVVCQACQLTLVTAERDALAQRVAALEAERNAQYYLLLKWGSFKGGCFNEAMEAIFEKYKAAGLSSSGADEGDTDEQHALLHDLIDACPGEISNDYCGTVYTKAEAHAYLDDWRKRKAAKANQEPTE